MLVLQGSDPSHVDRTAGTFAPAALPCPFAARLEAVSSMIGGTPLLAIDLTWRGRAYTVHAKAEHYNMTGSIKDRMALNIIRTAIAEGRIGPRTVLAEATSGNAGIALTAVGRALGLGVRIFMPDWMSAERQQLMRALGADLTLVSRAEGGFIGAIERTQALASENPDVFLPCQFSNASNTVAHRETTGPEIIRQLAGQGLTIDAFVAGVGTGGTVMGVGSTLKGANPDVKVYALEPAESPTLSTGHKVGSHRIQGISDDFIPAIINFGQLDGVISANDGDAILMAQKLACTLGLAVGISSGANLIGALKVAEQLGQNAVVATVFCDDNKKYLSTDLARSEPIKNGYLSPDIELTGFRCVRCV